VATARPIPDDAPTTSTRDPCKSMRPPSAGPSYRAGSSAGHAV
jgi:hypothetical protein